jgi:molecular chaperone GrpE (heat shock protein)
MKLPLLCASLLLLSMSACSKGADAAPAEPPKQGVLDKAKDKLGAVAGAQEVQATLQKLKAQLAKVTDGASAQQAKTELQQLVASLKQQVDAKGGVDKIASDLGSTGEKLLAAARQQIDALVKDPQVQQSLGPVLQQLKAVLGG